MPVNATNGEATAISWTPSTFWDGNDGSWNSFIVQVGTPPQEFRVLPSTGGQELWIPLTEGCTSISPNDTQTCGYQRGALPFNNVNSSGFATNESSTWKSNGIFELNAQQKGLGYGGNGLYGFDTVTWGNVNDSLSLPQQVVAGIADPAWWLGQVGLGPKTINFTTFNDPIPSFLGTLYNSSKIPSHSFGYTAGAAHRNHSSASLTLGGYDTNRFEEPGLSLPMGADNSRQLQVGLRRILATNTLDGTVNLLPKATYHLLDSSVPHIWLPEDSINAFVSAFGLTYDNATDLYLINDTMRARMLELKHTVTFVIGAIQGSVTESISIEIPYAAFDLQASAPFYENKTNYFPIRRAANNTQYTIGRTFLQEAYVIADFDRSNFTVAKACFDRTDRTKLVEIKAPGSQAGAEAELNETRTGAQGLVAGAIAGIAVGAVVVLALLAVLIWFCSFRKRQKRTRTVEAEPKAFLPSEKPSISGDRAYTPLKSEMPSENALHEAEGDAKDPVFEADPQGLVEMETPDFRHEVDAEGTKKAQELAASPVVGFADWRRVAEMEGSQGVGMSWKIIVFREGGGGIRVW